MTTDIDISTSQISERESQLAEHEGLAAPTDPSIAQILYHAISQKVDVGTLERLVALKERVDAEKAERELNAALRQFRKNCPQILKTRSVFGKAKDDKPAQEMYRFANLEDVKAIVDPRLDAHDLSYSWDGEFVNGMWITTCTVRHSGGGKRSSKFSSGAAGAPNMNAAQSSASTTTYGQRYSLLAVLGISADLDDDGRRAGALPAPEHDPNAPQVGTREERAVAARDANASTSVPPQEAKPVEPPVTKDEINALASRWKSLTGSPDPTNAAEKQELAGAFAYFCDKSLGFAEPSGRKYFTTSAWTKADLARCLEACAKLEKK